MKLDCKYKKGELENMIFVEKLSYREIGRRYGVSDAYIKKNLQQIRNKINPPFKISRKLVPP